MSSQRQTVCHYLHTGQRACHADAWTRACVRGSGRDASFAVGTPWPEPRFEMLHAGMLDRLTDLLWRRSANLTPQPVAWGEALSSGHPFADVQDLYWSSTTSLKARRALGKSGSHSFRCGPWQRSAK